MSATIQHMEPEENYMGGDEYYEDEEYEEEYVDDPEYFEEHEYVEEVIDEIIGDEEEYVEEEEYYEEEEDDDNNEESQGGGLSAMIAAAASKRQDRLDQGGFQVTAQNDNDYEEDDDDDNAPPQGGMAGMIAAAANKRTDRLEQGGERKITHVEKAPDEELDMAAMIAKKANARNDRIEAGGELKVREIPKEHKNVFVNVAMEAARIGTLTRLNEHTVQAVAAGKEEEIWGGPSGLRTDHLRSRFFMAVNEAAALGAMKRQKPHEVTNYDQNEYIEEEEPEDIDKMTDQHGRRVVRQLYLIDRKIEEERKYKHEDWSAENAANVIRFKSLDDVALPTTTAPKWRPKKTEKTHRELMDSISNGVAERAWERNYRLNRPKANLMVTRTCKCKYCVNPNPYQTHKYKQMESAGVEKFEGPLLEKKEDDKKKSAKAWNSHVRQTRNVRPGEWSEASSYTPVPNAVPKYKVTSPTPKPIADSGPEPAKVAPEPMQAQPDDDDGGEPGVMVLLDETTTWGHKREKTPKPKKDTKKKKKKKSSKKKEGKDGGCSIM